MQFEINAFSTFLLLRFLNLILSSSDTVLDLSKFVQLRGKNFLLWIVLCWYLDYNCPTLDIYVFQLDTN